MMTNYMADPVPTNYMEKMEMMNYMADPVPINSMVKKEMII